MKNKFGLVGLLATSVLAFAGPQLGNGQESKEPSTTLNLDYDAYTTGDIEKGYLVETRDALSHLKDTVNKIRESGEDLSKKYSGGTPQYDLQGDLYYAARNAYLFLFMDGCGANQIPKETHEFTLSALRETERIFGDHKLDEPIGHFRGLGDYARHFIKRTSSNALRDGYTLPKGFEFSEITPVL